jgi:hypothetical protein
MHCYPGKLNLHAFVTYWKMSSTSVDMLNSLYALYPFDTVVSSTWQQYHDRDQIEDLFQANGLNLHLHDDWCTRDSSSNPFRSYRGRASEIADWLRNHCEVVEEDEGELLEYPSHIILDDPWSGAELEEWRSISPLQKPYIIDPNVGIDPEVFKFMLSDVRSWSMDYSTRSFRVKI